MPLETAVETSVGHHDIQKAECRYQQPLCLATQRRYYDVGERDPHQGRIHLLARPQIEHGRPFRGNGEEQIALREEARPRNATIAEVGGDHLAQRPSLQVRALNVRAQHDAIAERADAMSELDVLDLRPGKAPLVVHSRFDEHMAANRAATSPERVRLARVVRVCEVMEQIAVLRH